MGCTVVARDLAVLSSIAPNGTGSNPGMDYYSTRESFHLITEVFTKGYKKSMARSNYLPFGWRHVYVVFSSFPWRR